MEILDEWLPINHGDLDLTHLGSALMVEPPNAPPITGELRAITLRGVQDDTGSLTVVPEVELLTEAGPQTLQMIGEWSIYTAVHPG